MEIDMSWCQNPAVFFFLLLFLCNMPCRVKEHGSKRVSVTRQSEQDTQGVHQQARGFSQATVEPSVQHPTMTGYSWITGLQKCLEKTFIVSSDLWGSDAVHLWCRRRSLTYVFRHSFLIAELNSNLLLRSVDEIVPGNAVFFKVGGASRKRVMNQN